MINVGDSCFDYVVKNYCFYGEISNTLIVSCFFLLHIDVFEKALNAGFIQATDYVEIWQAYLDYLRRRVDFSKGESSCVSKVIFTHALVMSD